MMQVTMAEEEAMQKFFRLRYFMQLKHSDQGIVLRNLTDYGKGEKLRRNLNNHFLRDYVSLF